MEPMSIHLRVLGVIGLFLGPFLFLLRGNIASPLEKFFYAVIAGPMVLLVIGLHYKETKKKVLGGADQQACQARWEELRKGFHKLFLIVVLALIVATASIAWFLFWLAPET